MYKRWGMCGYELYEVDLTGAGQDIYLAANIIAFTAIAPGMEGETLLKLIKPPVF